MNNTRLGISSPIEDDTLVSDEAALDSSSPSCFDAVVIVSMNVPPSCAVAALFSASPGLALSFSLASTMYSMFGFFT
jgi:hypothetical protein